MVFLISGAQPTPLPPKKPGNSLTGIWFCLCLPGDTDMHPQPQVKGLFIGHDISVPLSCSLINNDHDMSAQWAVKSFISTDQKSHEARASRGLLVLVLYCEENVLINDGNNAKLRAVH